MSVLDGLVGSGVLEFRLYVGLALIGGLIGPPPSTPRG